MGVRPMKSDDSGVGSAKPCYGTAWASTQKTLPDDTSSRGWASSFGFDSRFKCTNSNEPGQKMSDSEQFRVLCSRVPGVQDDPS